AHDRVVRVRGEVADIDRRKPAAERRGTQSKKPAAERRTTQAGPPYGSAHAPRSTATRPGSVCQGSIGRGQAARRPSPSTKIRPRRRKWPASTAASGTGTQMDVEPPECVIVALPAGVDR